MRISKDMAESLVQLSQTHIGHDAVVWLFGSRVHDEKKGGDIDVMIEAANITFPLNRKIDFRLAFEDCWGEQKLDIIIHDTCQEDLAIHTIVRSTGIRLN